MPHLFGQFSGSASDGVDCWGAGSLVIRGRRVKWHAAEKVCNAVGIALELVDCWAVIFEEYPPVLTATGVLVLV